MDIKSIAVEAGIYQDWMEGHEIMEVTMLSLERFAALVEKTTKKKCADTCYKDKDNNIVLTHGTGKRLDMLCAEVIRSME